MNIQERTGYLIPTQPLNWPRWICWVVFVFAGSAALAKAPVYIGIDEAYSIKTNTSPRAIEMGAQAAIDEINERGGVLGSRPLRLAITDNQGVSARGRDNFIALASRPDVVAVMTGKFGPITLETAPEAERMRVPLVSVWGSADQITDSRAAPSFVFRLSLKDSWGVEALMLRAKSAHKASRLCAILPNTASGRSADNVLKSKAAAIGVTLVSSSWYNWGEEKFTEVLADCVRLSAQAILMVADEKEASFILNQKAQLPALQRLPVVAHWGLTGGVIHELAGPALEKLDMQVIQTFTFIGNQRPAAQRLARRILRDPGISTMAEIPSPVGAAHAYDMTHLIAMAVNQAGSTRGEDVRRALENLPPFDGAVRRYAPAFTATRHDALTPKEVLFVRIRSDGLLVPLK